MSSDNILICGLPNSGKTTFIAALWYLIYNEEIDTSLGKSGLPDKRDYLYNLSEKWSSLSKISHTPTGEIQEVSIPLVHNSVEIILNIPDMSGETWKDLWISRLCSRKTQEWCSASSGILLFVHSDQIRSSLEITTANAMQSNPVNKYASETKYLEKITEWDPEKAPTQVMLVDILQSISSQPLGDKTKKLAIVLSAWDIVIGQGASPDIYLQKHLPLLYQYIFCSNHFKDVKIFGISAQGGDLDAPEQLSQLRNIDKPSERIIVVDGASQDHDITKPIQWLIAE